MGEVVWNTIHGNPATFGPIGQPKLRKPWRKPGHRWKDWWGCARTAVDIAFFLVEYLCFLMLNLWHAEPLNESLAITGHESIHDYDILWLWPDNNKEMTYFNKFDVIDLIIFLRRQIQRSAQTSVPRKCPLPALLEKVRYSLIKKPMFSIYTDWHIHIWQSHQGPNIGTFLTKVRILWFSRWTSFFGRIFMDPVLGRNLENDLVEKFSLSLNGATVAAKG